MTRADLGRAAEARFLLDAHERGLLVSRPFDSLPSYDCIVDNGSRLFRVQVKGSRPSISLSRSGTNVYRINVDRDRTRRIRFDVAAVWLSADARWVFLPSKVARKCAVNLRANGRYSRRGWEVFSRRR